MVMEFDEMFEVFNGEYLDRDWDKGDGEGKIRIALVGLGWFSRDEALPAIADCEYATVNATISGSIEKARQVADEANAETALTYEQFHAGEAADTYDAVYVCTPNALHLQHVEAAAELGKDVICEKPMEATLERAQAIVDACDHSGVTLMIAYRMHSDPVIRRIRELIAAGFVGDVAQVIGSYTAVLFGDGTGDPDQWRLDGNLAGGGSLYDIGIYPLNTTRFVLDADPTSVRASLSIPHEQFDDPVVDEHATVLLEFNDGIQSLFRSSYGSFNGNELLIEGNEGRIVIENSFDYDAPRTVVLERDGHTARYENLYVNELTEEFDYFAYCCLTDRTPNADGEHGLTDMRALEGAQSSAIDGHRVDLR